VGRTAVDDTLHMHELQAPILYLQGLDHERFAYRYSGRAFHRTNVGGNIAEAILA
jgi:hypothetical protein